MEPINANLAISIRRGALPPSALLGLTVGASAQGFTEAEVRDVLADFVRRSREPFGSWQAAWNALTANGLIALRHRVCPTCRGRRFNMRTDRYCSECNGTAKGVTVRLRTRPAPDPAATD